MPEAPIDMDQRRRVILYDLVLLVEHEAHREDRNQRDRLVCIDLLEAGVDQRLAPITLSAYEFCQGERGAILSALACRSDCPSQALVFFGFYCFFEVQR